MKTAFIINPASAGGKTNRIFCSLRTKIESSFPSAQYYHTEYPRHARQLAQECAKAGFERVIGVGGDGTFNEIVNGLFVDQKPLNPELVFGTLPMGTGGDFIRSLAIPRAPLKALEELRANLTTRSNVGHVILQDFEGKAIERYFINLFNFGVGGLTSILVNQASKAMGGRVSFLKGALRAAFQFQSRPVSIRVNQQQFYTGMIKNVALANGRYCGGGMIMAPSARVDSGQFQLVLLPDMPMLPFLMQLPKVYWGGHIGLKQTKTCFVNCLEVDTEANDVYLEMDGETPGKLPLKAKCLQNILRVNVGAAYQSQ